jgi:hypothetical protein
MRYSDDNKTATYTLSDHRDDSANGFLSVRTPLGKHLLGCVEEDEIELEVGGQVLQTGVDTALNFVSPIQPKRIPSRNSLRRTRVTFSEHHNGQALIVRTVDDGRSRLVGGDTLVKTVTANQCCVVRTRHLGHRHVILRLATRDDVPVKPSFDGLDSCDLLGNVKGAGTATDWRC